MRLSYYADTDSLYIDLTSRPSAESFEIAEGLIADFDADGAIVGFDVEHASKTLDLGSLEFVNLPLPIGASGSP